VTFLAKTYWAFKCRPKNLSPSSNRQFGFDSISIEKYHSAILQIQQEIKEGKLYFREDKEALKS
jgi:hypothetical protein